MLLTSSFDPCYSACMPIKFKLLEDASKSAKHYNLSV